jgi:hypothetical protein
MRTCAWLCALVLVVAVTAIPAAQNAKRPRGVFSSLKVGQAVTLKDEGSAYTINFFDEDVPLAHWVVEIGNDFVVVRDVAGVRETLIPVFSLKGIEKMTTKSK